MPQRLPRFGLTAHEWREFRRCRNPVGVQTLLNSLSYHDADTCWSPRRVLRERTAHCMEGAMLGAAAMRVLGYPPLVLDLEGEQDSDHVIVVYRHAGSWGAVSKSHFNGLRDRPPIFRNLRELALSYFEDYYNMRGQRTLRTYSRPVNLARFDRQDWMTSEKAVWCVPYHLLKIPHIRLLSEAQTRMLHRLDKLAIDAGLLGHKHS